MNGMSDKARKLANEYYEAQEKGDKVNENRIKDQLHKQIMEDKKKDGK